MLAEDGIVGREAELHQIADFLDGRPGTALLDGPSGIGKTTIWQQGLHEARRRGFRVLHATPGRSEQGLSFAAVGDLLGPVADSLLPTLPDPQARALAGALLLAEPESRSTYPAALAVACRSSIRALAADRRVLVAIDDVQWLDGPSSQVLGYVVRRLTSEPVWLLIARSNATPAEAPPFDLGRSASDRPLVRIQVGALSLGALHRVLRIRLGLTFSRSVLFRLHKATRGNPLYGLELARWLTRDDVELEPGRPLGIPPTLVSLIDDRLARQPRAVRHLLAAAAALSRPSAGAVGSEQALTTARRAGLVEVHGDEVVFTHPLIAAAAYQSLAPDQRRALHARLASVAREPEERARHLALAAPRRRERVAASLESAARHAADRGSPDGASELMELAVRLTPENRHAALTGRRLALAEHLRASGEHLRANELFSELIAELPPGAQRARALLRLADRAGSVGRSRSLLEQALADASDEPALKVEILVALSGMSLIGGDLTRARNEVHAAVEAARQVGDQATLAQALGSLGLMDALSGVRHPDSFWQEAMRVEQAAELPEAYGPRQAYGMVLMYEDRLEEARRLLLSARQDAMERGLFNVQSSVDLHLTELECRLGNLESAREFAEDGYLLESQPGIGQLEGSAPYALALVSMYQGRAEEARRLASEGLEKADVYGDRVFRAQNLAVLGYLELSLGDPKAAYDHLAGVADELMAGGYREPSVYPVLPNTIEALVLLGRSGEARRLLTVLEDQGLALDSAWALGQACRYRGLMAADGGDIDSALRHFEEALAQHVRQTGPFERARTLLALGRVLRRGKRRREAREALTSAMESFEELGAPLWRARAVDELARIGGRRAEPGLTPTELRVAALVVRGRSNKEVAAELFVTVSSVERHLTRIYAKLGVTSRVELVRAIGDSSLAE